MLAKLFAEWVSQLPGFVLIYSALFGFPKLGIHGFLSSLWTIAVNVGGFRAEMKNDFEAVRVSQSEIKATVERVEKRLDKLTDDDSIRFSVGR